MKKKLIVLLIIVFVIMLCLLFYYKYYEYKYININNIDIPNVEIDADKASYFFDLDKYIDEYKNDQIIGLITIMDTDFSMLFAQSDDNSYYLDHLLNHEYTKLGSTFLDYRVDIDNSRKINIYGHNNNDVGVSFNYIMNYENKSFFDKYDKIYIYTKDTSYVCEVFSVQIVDSNYIHMKVDFNNDYEFYDYLDNVLANSIYYREINYDEVSRVLTLQTCTNRKDLEYLLVNARLI